MKALSVWPEWAMPIMLGQKTVECRSWPTSHSGPLLVCSSARKADGCVCGHAICVVNLVRVEPYGPEHDQFSMLDFGCVPERSFAWVLDGVKMVRPFPVRGSQRLFDVPDGLVEVLGEPSRRLVERHILPIVHRSRNSEADEIWSEVFDSLGWL